MANIITIKHFKKDGDRLQIELNYHAFKEWLKTDDSPDKPDIATAKKDLKWALDASFKSLFDNVGRYGVKEK